nr:12502_t:CDS:2 [Entrophospora candida]
MSVLQPFTEQFQEKFENYLQPRYEKIGQQLYKVLVRQFSAWIGGDDSTKRPNTTPINVFEKIVIDYHASIILYEQVNGK